MNFSPYQPPPDVPSTDPPETSSKSKGKGKTKRPWFNRDPSTYSSTANSYQAGGSLTDPSSIPQSYTNEPESAAFLPNGSGGGGMGGMDNDASSRANAWESRFGWRVDLMGAATYLGGPVTALLFLILETQNDYVRFHAYQSALLTTPILAFLLLVNLLIPFPKFIRIVFTLASLASVGYTSFRAWKDAQDGLARFWVPYIGEIAERWVGEE